jgi:hypothetical protein
MNSARAVFALVAAAALGACGTSDTLTAGIDAGGAPVAIVVQGPITGFGSIIVNGVHYDIDRAQISVNGVPASATDLALGQLVTISGTRDANAPRGQANSVSFDAKYEDQGRGCTGTLTGKGKAEKDGSKASGTLDISDSCGGALSGTFRLWR